MFKKIAVIGFGGFAREITCNLKQSKFDYFSELQLLKSNSESHLHIHSLEYLNANKYTILIAIGDSYVRQKIVNLLPKNVEFYSYFDKYARILDKTTTVLGYDNILSTGTIFTTNIKTGNHCHFNLNCTVGHDTKIGNYVTLTPGVHISGNCQIGEHVYFGSGAIVKNGIQICDNVVIGMGSVVTKNIDQSGIYVGSPAQKIKDLTKNHLAN